MKTNVRYRDLKIEEQSKHIPDTGVPLFYRDDAAESVG
jgi:hypothetical protein